MSNAAQLSAKDRILTLLDDNSFVEIGAQVTKRSTDFNLGQKEVPSDGVVTGYGVVNGNPVFVYSQDVTAMNGSIGEMHAKKISNLYDLALKSGVPVIGLVDCAGLRLQEATDALAGVGDVYLKQSLASGVILQITAVFGSCGGSSAVSAFLSDFVFMEEKNAKLFVNAPNTLAGNNSTKCDTAAAKFQTEAGNVDFLGEDEESVLNQIRSLMSVLPGNNKAEAVSEEADNLNRVLYNFDAELDDVTLALTDLSDNSFFMEVKKSFAEEMVTGFIRMNGKTVGCVANRIEILGEDGKAEKKMEASLTSNGCAKAEEFVSFCDAFNIPILTLVNVNGYSAKMEEEKTIGKAAAKLTYAFAHATVPKVSLITKQAMGSAYITMNSKHIGADMVFALPDAKIGTMDSDLAVQIMYAEELKNADPSFKAEKAAEYEALCANATSAAKRGYVDAVIESSMARQHIVYAFEMLYGKKESRPSKKHGTV